MGYLWGIFEGNCERWLVVLSLGLLSRLKESREVIGLIHQIRILKNIPKIRVIQERLIIIQLPLLNSNIAHPRRPRRLFLFILPPGFKNIINDWLRLLCFIRIAFLFNDLIKINYLFKIIVMLDLVDCVIKFCNQFFIFLVEFLVPLLR